MDLHLEGARAVITGGSRGIGLAIADALASEGAAVGLIARGEEGLAAAVEQVGRHGRAVATASADGESRVPLSRPSARKTTRSAKEAATGSWVTITMVCRSSSTIVLSIRSTSPLVAESSAPVGSSANNTSGRVIRARAIATRCCCPPDIWLGRCPARPLSLTRQERRRQADRPLRAPAAVPASMECPR